MVVWFRLGVGVCALGLLAAGCGSARSRASEAPSSAPGSSVPLPHPSVTGCVESRELKEYVLALDAERDAARRAALAASGAAPELRRGTFGDAAAPPLDETWEVGGKRYAVVGALAPGFEPAAPLARRGDELYRLDERPRAHAVELTVCGVLRCPRRSAPRAPVPARPLLVELGDGERFAGALPVAYDYWWANVSYDRAETCGAAASEAAAPPAREGSAPPAREASAPAASATP
jgi:hypothetical protein